MPDAKMVAQYLPFLRRYARALTGNQASGDAYVAATLEALIADPAVIEEPKGPRVALYRLFTKIWNSISVNGTKVPRAALPGEQKLASITPLPRQAFLLVALEGFAERGRRPHSRYRRHDFARPGRGIRPRACGRDRHRRADHRG